MMYGPVLYQAFRELKQTFDPNHLLNPGKIVDAPSLLTNLRYGSGYVTPEVPTTFDFSADGGLVRSAELCAGVGECRKTRGGRCAPLFRRHATNGTAPAAGPMLETCLTGQLGFEGMTDPALKEVLDLCLECKACKAECPTNVDMARLKAEFLHSINVPSVRRFATNLRPCRRLLPLGISPCTGLELGGAKSARSLAQ